MGTFSISGSPTSDSEMENVPISAGDFSVARLSEELTRLVRDALCARYCVAYSGGVDSTALLHAMVMLRNAHPRLALRALHVNHHLQPGADHWALHCRDFAARWSVALEVLDIRVARTRGESTEAAARAARYAALSMALAPDEHLLTAHHRDDQVETVLLQLMRGAGVAGLSGMPERSVIGSGILLRPLLGVDHADLIEYARNAGLRWIDDTSNEDLRFDRNFVRQRVLPGLRARWQGMAASVARSARHLAEAQALLDERAREDLVLAGEGANLRVSALRTLSPARARNLLRYWIDRANHPVPSSAVLGEALRQVLRARADTTPLIEWGRVQLRRYRDGVYLCRPQPEPPRERLVWRWVERGELELPDGLGRLRLRAARPGEAALSIPSGALQVGWNQGTHRLRLSARGSRRTLRNLYQERGVVPWLRRHLPLVFVGDSLAAVADLWIDAQFRARDGEQGMAIEWLDHPPIF